MIVKSFSRMARRLLMLLLVTCAIIAPVQAQDATPTPDAPAGQPVTIEAGDGLALYGVYHVPPGAGQTPALLLLHQLYTTSRSWNTVVGSLLASGYRVLAVDLRGYGVTRGGINWARAQDDTLRWLAWLANQPGVNSAAIFTMGSSMGANLAIAGCAAADRCAGAVALSPGLNYFGVRTRAALTEAPVLVVYADRDSIPGRDVPRMVEIAAEAENTDLTAIAYAGRAHGVALFSAYDDVLGHILDWLDAHRR